MKLTRNRLQITFAVLALLGGSTVAGAYWYRESNKTDGERTVEAVARHYYVPSDEEPAVLTVLDANNLSSTYLKSIAQNGDKLLVYQGVQKIIVYRPSLDRIIDVGPALIDDIDAR